MAGRYVLLLVAAVVALPAVAVPAPFFAAPSGGAPPPLCGLGSACAGTLAVHREPPAPQAVLTVALTAVPLAGPPVLLVTFSAHARGGNLSGPYSFTWSFGDGSPPVTDTVVSTPPVTNDTVSHGYSQVGNYTVAVTVDDNGATAVTSVVIRVTNQLLVSVVAAPAVITLGETSILTVNASGGASPYTYSWSGVPPGCLARAGTLTCSPQLPGNYSIVAQVVDSIGETATATFHLLVNPPITVTARALARYVCNAGAGTATFNLSGGAAGGTPPYSYYWDPGDGSPRVTGPLVSHTYPLGGTYNATLTVYDSTGANATGVAHLTTNLPGCSVTSTEPFFGPPQYLIVGISAVGVAVAALLYWDWRRRPRAVDAPPPGASPEPFPPSGTASEGPALSPPPSPSPEAATDPGRPRSPP